MKGISRNSIELLRNKSIIGLAALIALAALLMQLKNFSLIGVQRSLPSNLESIQSSHSLRLTTAFHGVGKEIFIKESRASMNKNNLAFGDDSW
jgi:hypothetical protein